MAEYMILIFDDEATWAAAAQDEFDRMLTAHNRFAEQVVELGGKIVSGHALQPSPTATSIRGDVVTDGPFAETKEALGGYYLVEAEDLDKALAIGKLVPVLNGGVEVRPIMVF
ncbi:MAG TPA: YciI family protein [Actinocrinis sp.]|uniref:YciI family protein n=1 Tax=Actinocrinis sp. TaxID=1920516 RepID=UPI002DDD2769|nr:YciI family protein [Actinocrinis sp.]HEV2344963.1 YciI family protein [Actinocrinis sp.]